MNASPDDRSTCDNRTDSQESYRLRWSVYGLLIAIATGGMVGRILAVNSVDALRLETHLKTEHQRDVPLQRPFLSANDRSRWATVRSLVEHGTFAIDTIVSEPGWDSIDVVKHDDQGREAPSADEGKIYSSKPPLFSVLMAAPYWVIHKVTGRTLGTNPYEIGRFMIVTWNVLPLMIYFVLWGRIADRIGTTDWGRIFTMACACFGTFLTTFAVSINNHLPAAVTTLATVYVGMRITIDGERRWRYFALAGVFAALTVCNELPSLSFFAAVSLLLLWKAPRETMLCYVPLAALVFAVAAGTNYVAHHSWRPPYAHRQDGDNWYKFQFVRDGKVRDSYWSNVEGRSKIDQGEASVPLYAVHVLVGHHGIFLLTPIWLLSVAGLVYLLGNRLGPGLRDWGALIAAVSLVCIAFYLTRGQTDRNYGGMTSAFRWAFWMAPLWLVAMQPAVDALSRSRAGRVTMSALLALSVMSASYPTWNPWTQPWMYRLLENLG